MLMSVKKLYQQKWCPRYGTKNDEISVRFGAPFPQNRCAFLLYSPHAKG